MTYKISTKNITQFSVNVLTFWAEFAIIGTVRTYINKQTTKSTKRELVLEYAVEPIHGKDEVTSSNLVRGSRTI